MTQRNYKFSVNDIKNSSYIILGVIIAVFSIAALVIVLINMTNCKCVPKNGNKGVKKEEYGDMETGYYYIKNSSWKPALISKSKLEKAKNYRHCPGTSKTVTMDNRSAAHVPVDSICWSPTNDRGGGNYYIAKQCTGGRRWVRVSPMGMRVCG